MHRCCVPGCQSYKYRKGINLLYFKFPLNNKSLLKKWLEGIGRRNWFPCENDHICNQHFQSKDIDNKLGLCPNLKVSAIPTIFSQNKISVPPNCTWKTLNNSVENRVRKINTLVQPTAVTTISTDTVKSLSTNAGIAKLEESCQSKRINPTFGKVIGLLDNSSNSVIGKLSGSTNTIKIPVLKITINKKYNMPCTLSKKSCKEPVSSSTNKIATFVETNCNNKVNINNSDVQAKPNIIQNQIQNISMLQPIELCLVSVASEQPTNDKNVGTEAKHDVGIVKTAYARRGDLSRDITCQTSAERLRYLYTKAQRDCDVLRIRLRALRERYRDEKKELKKLWSLSHKFPSNFRHKSICKISNQRPKRKKSAITLGDTGEEVECQKLFKKIKIVKQDMLKQKYPILDSNTPLGQILASTMSTIHHRESKIKKRLKKLLKKNKHSAVNSIKSRDKIDKVIDNCDELIKVSEESNTNFETDDNNTLRYEEQYLDPVYIEH